MARKNRSGYAYLGALLLSAASLISLPAGIGGRPVRRSFSVDGMPPLLTSSNLYLVTGTSPDAP